MKTTNNVVTKYVYGLGLIGEEVNGEFKTYHFDSRGSTIAITDENGTITDTFVYDTYGKQIDHVGESNIIFGYNGRDGVVTDKNGLIYMRARYYSPEMRRFINSDIVAGEITEAVTLNRYAYANGNPVMNIDPFGLACHACGSDGFNSACGICMKNSRTPPKTNIGSEDSNGQVVDKSYYYRTKNTTSGQKVSYPKIDYSPTIDNNEVIDYEAQEIEKKNQTKENSGEEVGDWFHEGKNIEIYPVHQYFAETFGAKLSIGKEKSEPPQYYLFATVENGIGYSKDFGDDKPINVYASAGEHWWEFWEWSVGIDVNINGYGAGISIGGEISINIHAGNVSHEVGVNAIGRISHKVAYNAGDGYVYTKYSLKGKEYIHSAIEQGYEPAKEAIKAINKNLNAQIIFGVCNLLYYASGIIEERVDDMYASEQIPTIDKKQRREIQDKKQGIIMSEM